jgi:hypothetical protein
LLASLLLAGCAGLKIRAEDRAPTRFCKSIVRAVLVLPSLGSSEWAACSKGGDEQWRATFAAFDEAIRESNRQWRQATTEASRARALRARRRFSRIRTDLGAEYIAWRRVPDCRRTTLISG